MKINRRLLLLVALWSFAGNVFGQDKLSASWSLVPGGTIHWQRVHSLGYLVVGGQEALYGIDPVEGKVIWTNQEFANLPVSSYAEVDGTEFITITPPSREENTLPMQAIINVENGKVLFDSGHEQIGVLSRHVLPSSARLLVIGVKPGTLVASLFMYDIASGKQLWANRELFKGESAGGGLLGKLQAVGQQLQSLQSLTSEPVELDDNTMLITHPFYVMRINSETGDVIWKNKIEESKRAEVYFSPYREGVAFVGVEVEGASGAGFTTASGEPAEIFSNLYYAFDIETGKPLWDKPAKENDRLNRVIVHEKGLIICPRSSQKPTINLVDYQTGQTMWGKKGKGIKAQGSVVSYLPTKEGILITTAFDNAWNNKAEEYYLNILDPNTGTLRYDKSIKLKGDLVSSELVPKGLLFVTTREVNILDTNTGALLWSNSIESGGAGLKGTVKPFPTGAKGDKLYVFSAKEAALFEIDKVAGTYRKMTGTTVEFEGKELPTAIDVLDDGVLVYSEQNIMKFSPEGSVMFSKYYPAPREPGVMRALLLAQSVYAAYVGTAAAAYSAAASHVAAQSADVATQQVGSQLAGEFADLSRAGFSYSRMAMQRFSMRHKASQNAPDFVMMMTRQEKRGVQLIQVSKSTGEVLNAIDIKNDREPEYDLDQIYRFVYYRPDALTIVCYKL